MRTRWGCRAPPEPGDELPGSPNQALSSRLCSHPGTQHPTRAVPRAPPSFHSSLGFFGRRENKTEALFFCRRQVSGKANCRVITGLYRSRPSIRCPRPADRVQSQIVVETSGAVTAHVPLYLGNAGSRPSLTSGNKSGNQLLN